MSKKNKTATVQPLSENTRRAIIITAIIVVAVIILSVALALILKPSENTPSDNNSSSSGSSSLTIRNGDFFYTTSDDTAYPKTAQNWNKYGYKAKESSSHDFESISTNENVLMGIVTTAEESTDGSDTWEDVLEDLGYEDIHPTKNPGKYDSDLDDDNVYMIAAKDKFAASILSDSFSVSSGKSVKITVHLNAKQVTDGNPVIMIQDSTTSALSKYWYAYDFEATTQNGENEEGDWFRYEFYIFNRETSTKHIRVSVGLGNVYSGEENLELTDGQPIQASGILFVDGITYEEVTANDYRLSVDSDVKATDNRSLFKIIENEDIEDESTYLAWTQEKTYRTTTTYADSKAFSDSGEEYFPFTDRDDFFKDEENPEDEENPQHNNPTGFKITKLVFNDNNLAAGDNVGFRLDSTNLTSDKDKGENKGINTLYSMWYKDHHHITFWLRVTQQNEVAEANIYVQTWENGEWTDLDSGSWTSIVTSKEIDTDSNCGWQKYDIYLKPSAVEQEVSILVTLGEKEISAEDVENKLIPKGTLYITTPAYEKISSKDYNNASSGSYSKKLDLIGVSATTSVTNGSFSTADNSVTQPSSWSPAFAGDSMLYRDGKDDDADIEIKRKRADVEGSGILRGVNEATEGVWYGNWDDEQGNVLQIKNNTQTSFGYFSNDITLSARNLYVFSVLAKGNNAHFYLMNTDTTLERTKRVIAEGKTTGEGQDEKALGQLVLDSELQNGWHRYYIVILTGDESQAVRLVLFNGSIDGKTKSNETVYFDAVQMLSLGNFATSEDTENKDAEKYIVTWSMGNYELNNKAVTIKDFLTKEQVELLVKVGALELDEGEEAAEGTFANLLVGKENLPDEEAWNAMLKVPEEETPTEDQPTDSTTETESSPVDLGLLFSVISSVALVAALLVVVVVKIFKNRKTKKKAA